uniref:Olfactory receptor n=1 Tax=Tetraodon nigroviridis TaxID=99883 RepID=H3C6Y2_TETNG
MNNTSVVTMFTLSGFDSITEHRFILFALTFVFYCVIVQVNVTLIVIIIIDKSLHEPMFIFICNLCINALYRTAGFYPKFLMDILSDSHVISYAGCFVQSLVVTSSTCVDFSFLVLMAYDRYVAICRPLVYHSVMNTQRVSVLVFAAWFVPVVQMLVIIISTSTIRLCSNKIQRIFCGNWNVVKLSCVSTIVNNIYGMFLTIVTIFFPLLYVLYTYVQIVAACWKGSIEFRRKVFHSCLPHVIS